MKYYQKNKMNFLKFKSSFVSDDDGTFWPGVIEVPSETEVHFEEETKILICGQICVVYIFRYIYSLTTID